MRLAPAIAFSLIVMSSVPAFAFKQEDASACMSDAFRLCAASIPDAQRVASCLYSKRHQLSAACASAFSRHAQTCAHHHRSRTFLVND
jgi:hypothetical protein